MAITRKSLAAVFEAQDLIIEAANKVKRDAMIDYREQLTKDGWQKDDVKAEAEAFRKAFARFRAVTKHGETVVQEKDDRADAIYIEITYRHAPRATRVENIDEFDRLKSEPLAEHDADGVFEHITNPALAASNSDADAPVPSGAAKEVSPDASFAPIQPETANQAHSASDVNPAKGVVAAANEGGENEPVADVVTTETAMEVAPGGNTEADPVVSASVVEIGAPSSLTGSAADKSGEAGGVSPSGSPAPTKLKMNVEFFDEPHPLCRDKEFCGGNSNLVLCEKCRSAVGIDGHVHDADERVLN